MCWQIMVMISLFSGKNATRQKTKSAFHQFYTHIPSYLVSKRWNSFGVSKLVKPTTKEKSAISILWFYIKSLHLELDTCDHHKKWRENRKKQDKTDAERWSRFSPPKRVARTPLDGYIKREPFSRRKRNSSFLFPLLCHMTPLREILWLCWDFWISRLLDLQGRLWRSACSTQWWIESLLLSRLWHSRNL